MQRSLRPALLAAAILSATSGCTHSVAQQNRQPPDPLLVSKKPVEGKPTSRSDAREIARIDPQPPAFPGEDANQLADGQGVPARLSSELVVRPGP